MRLDYNRLSYRFRSSFSSEVFNVIVERRIPNINAVWNG